LGGLAATHTLAHAGHRVTLLDVGEPINPEAWNWFNEHVGRFQAAIVDTFSIVVTPFPGAIETKPGSATVPFFGIEPVILDPTSGKELEGNNVEGVLALRNPWPSILRMVFQDHQRYLETYMKPYPGVFYTGDGAARDEHGYI
ncbi:acetyl-CoA synthetase-like protein, partial [Auriscalpium vulgare]